MNRAWLMILCGLAAGAASAVAQPGPVPVPAPPVAPAVPDTVVIVVAAPDSLPQPLAVHVVQDTVAFGGLLDLVLDYDPDQAADQPLHVAAEGDWLTAESPAPRSWWARLTGRDSPREVDLAGLQPSGGPRVVQSFRVYRRDPLRIRYRDDVSAVVFVRGQTAGAEQTATIRAPRPVSWFPWLSLATILVLLGLAIWLRWLWLRRHVRPRLAHWPVPPPAWLALAVALRELLADPALARGDSRVFLDRLVYLVRTYVAGRYRIAAREMTGGEIVAACTRLGHEASHPAGFARLIDLLDRERYNPDTPSPAFCREQAVQLLGRVGRVRLVARYAVPEAEQLLAGEKAWSALVADLGLGAGRSAPATVSGDREDD